MLSFGHLSELTMNDQILSRLSEIIAVGVLKRIMMAHWSLKSLFLFPYLQ